MTFVLLLILAVLLWIAIILGRTLHVLMVGLSALVTLAARAHAQEGHDES